MSENIFNNKCRICLQSNKELEMQPFFNKHLGKFSLAAIFASLTSFEVQENEMFPKKICTICKTNITNFNNMITVFRKTDELLKKQIHKEKTKDGIGDFYFMGDKELSNEFDNIDDDYFDDSLPDIKYDDNGVKSNNITRTIDCNYLKKNIDFELQKVGNRNQRHKNENCTIDDTVRNNFDYNYISSFKYTCKCGDCFLHKSGFRQHMQFRHNVVLEDEDYEMYSQKIKLKIPIEFPNNVELVSSKVTVRKKKLQCRICDISFLTEEEVKTHEEIHKTYICYHCGAAFLKKNYLADHVRIHSEERRYTCKICQKTFKHRYTYNVHKRSHDIARNFVCETCGARFKTRGTMRTHIRIKHSNIRNYCCPNCNLKFNLKSTLDKHFMRKHTADRKKSFVCSKCGVAYLNKNTLTRHISAKHLGMAKYFPCTICENKTYVMKKGLRVHMLKKHGIIYQ